MIKGINTALVIIFYGLLYYFWLPTLSIFYFDGFLFFGIGIALLIYLVSLWKTEDFFTSGCLFACAVVVVALLSVVGYILGSGLFNSTSMYKQIGEIEEKSFTEDLLEVDVSQIPTVDIDLANNLADKKLGEELALGSQMEVGEFTNKQSVNGKLIYTAPLEHRGLFKWFSNMGGTTGFIRISATNSNDVELVRDVDGRQINLKYIRSAYFNQDLKRHLRFSGFYNVKLTEYSFELDDSGKPYWVVTTARNTTLWQNPEATGVVVCDPETGECTWYDVKDAPSWVDIIQPESFVINQIKNYGKYVHGFWNFSDKDKLSMTEHITTVYNEGSCYYYTGLSSVGRDNGTVGFILVNTRTKESKIYRMVGATESAAMSSAEGKVQNMGYYSTTPIPLNVSGIPTYFCTLKDNEGLVKAYAMINIEDYSIVETGSTIPEARRAYINAVNNSGASVDFSSNLGEFSVSGPVTRFGTNIENGNTYYYMVINNDTSKLFLASYTVSDELPVTREGDQVTVTYVDESSSTINISSFDNLGIQN